MVFPTDPSQSIVVQRMKEFQQDLLARDTETMFNMAERWLQLEGALEANISLLAVELSEAGQEVSLASVYRHRRYQALLSQMQAEMKAYDLWAAEYIAGNQQKLGVLGIEHAADAIRLSFIEGGLGAGQFFDKLPVSAIELMVGNAGDGGPIYELLQTAYPAAADNMTNILIQNTALGIGPGETAKAMMNGVAGGLNHALTVASTEQLRVYREASRMQYEASDAVSGYRRFASKSGNTCAVCLALDGELYPTKDLVYVHPRDRCAMIPLVKGVPEPKWELGVDWLGRQDSAMQQQIIGKGAFEMWENGEIGLMDLVKKTEHPIWGPSLQRNTLASLKQ